jgi:putative flippase GtrA
MYLLVGGWNTIFTYACFAVLYYLLGSNLPPSAIVALAYAVASVNGYVTFRSLVFTPVRHPAVEYLRYQAVYLPILAINMVALPLAVTYASMSPYLAQALLACFAVLAAYVGNKYFAFRRPRAD